MSKTSTFVTIVVVIVLAIAVIYWISSLGSPNFSQIPSQTGSTDITPVSSTTPSPTPTVSPLSSSSPSVTPGSSAVPRPVSVVITNFTFTPSTITIHRGTTVTWTNNDGAAHTVTGDNGGPNSRSLAKGQSYSYTFNATGSFPYHCSIHPMMKGVVVVE